MHPAEHRALRELLAIARALAEHWPRLAAGLTAGEGTPLRAGAAAAEDLLRDLEPLVAARGLPTRPTAQAVGARAAALRSAVVDRTLEVNQALRVAVLSVQHAVTLLRYLERLAGARGDAELRDAIGRGAERMAGHEEAVRALAVSAGDDPDRAVEPATPGVAGRLGHALACAMGSLGERIDRRASRRAS